MSATATVVKSMRQAAAQALEEGKVGVVIGYGRDEDSEFATPLFVREPQDAERLVFDSTCFGNLAVYLPRSEICAMGRIGLVVKGCDLRAVNVLLRENVIERDNVLLIGVCCSGVGDPPLDKCAVCEVRNPEGCDEVVGEAVDQPAVEAEQRYALAADIESKSLEERWEFWRRQFEKCIRCYACRQACPLCYCKRCIVEKTAPRWVESSPHLRGNLAWHLVRAFHLAGRCVGCGECERVCPVDIPLSAMNQKMAKLVEDWFGFRSGYSPDEQAPFTMWSADDPEEEIL
jgi:formate dehydrogenase subunit beta